MFKTIFRPIDAWLDRITMYRLLLYYLIALLVVAMNLSAFGYLNYNPLVIIGSALYLAAICYVTNRVFAWGFDAPTSGESSLITALILALIIPPTAAHNGVLFMTAAAGLAIASKYVLAIRKQHVFNPAAIAVVLTAIGPHQSASWWVGNPAMMPFVAIGGIVLIWRIRRIEMVAGFFGSALGATVLSGLVTHGNILNSLHKTIFSSALLFMGFVMLTEPATSPATKKHQWRYSLLTGLLFPPRVHIGSLFSTPALDLVIGNVFSYLVNPRVKLFPALLRKERITPDSFDFVFRVNRRFAFQPGQYMMWTLPHAHADARGTRRYFTIASSPTESNLRLGIKFYDSGSSFKHALLAMNKHTPIVAASLDGDFVLPADPARKIVLIAGGIGVTPYRSMIKYLIDKNEQRPLTLIYAARTAEDIAYKGTFEQARKTLGIKVVYTLTSGSTPIPDSHYRAGRITSGLLRSEVPDYRERLFYISGSQAMVDDVVSVLKSLGVHRSSIKTDFFSGYS